MTERADLPGGMPCEDCEQGLSSCCLEPDPIISGGLDGPPLEVDLFGDVVALAEGCPDCGQDTVAVDDDGGEYCTNVRCGWRP